MKLRDWRMTAGPGGTKRLVDDVAEELGVYASTVVRYENGTRDPDAVMKRKIFIMTGGAVEPNDFYDVPAWRRVLAAAITRLSGKAAA